MSVNTLRYGDLVLVDIKGRTFHAEYRGRDEEGKVKIMPLSPTRVSFRACRTREVKKVWRAPRARS